MFTDYFSYADELFKIPVSKAPKIAASEQKNCCVTPLLPYPVARAPSLTL
ncbi:hypothetical protein ACSX1A_19140 [Pontibacter sp. MBLB2868]